MSTPSDTWEFKPPTSDTTWQAVSNSPASENHPEAAAAARERIEELHRQAQTTADVVAATYDPLREIPVAVPAAPRASAKAPVKKPLPSRTRPIITAIGTFCMLLLVFKAPVLISQAQYLTQPKAATSTSATTTSNPEVGAVPSLIIPKINVNAPINFEPSVQEAAVQKALETGVVHYSNTALPGQAGNSVIVGHSSNDWWEPGNYKFVFVLLDKLIPGDTINLTYQGQTYTYQVTNTKVVEPTDLSVLAATPDPTLTIITCTPPGTSWKRLVVQAKQISPDPSKSTTQPATQTANAQSLPGSAPSFWEQLTQAWSNLFHHNPQPTTTTTPNAPDSAAQSLPGQ